MKRRAKGAEIVVSCLLEQGVDTVFGYPGVSILEIYDELYKNRRAIRHILTAHEQGAAHGADGYARSTGRVGVCMATSGPGATNLTTGIAAAFMDSSPVVFLTCNVDEELLGKDAFQEVDIVGISMPITKCSYLVDRAEDIAPVMREAFAIAVMGRPGPVLIDITHNATVERAEYAFLPKDRHPAPGRRGNGSLRKPVFQTDEVKKLAERFARAKRPVILAGGGVIRSGACEALHAYAERFGIPVVSTLMGLGSMGYDDPLFFGMGGMFGHRAANYALTHCDTLLAVGTRFSERLTGRAETFAPEAEILQIDIDRSEIDKNIPVEHYAVGDAGESLRSLAEIGAGPAADPMWLRTLEEKRTEPEEEGFPEAIIRSLHRLSPEAIIVTDVGQHQLWTCRGFGFSRPGQLITSGGYGAMGFGLGAALGAKAGNPGRTVIHITGDGSFGMNLTELMTEKREKLPVVTVIYDNGALGMVRQNQRLHHGGRYSQTDLSALPDYRLLGAAFGLETRRAETVEEFERALRDLLQKGGGGIIDCAVDRDAVVRPMVEKGRLQG